MRDFLRFGQCSELVQCFDTVGRQEGYVARRKPTSPMRLLCDRNANIVRPHHGTTYVDAAYCYISSSVVCRSVTVVSRAKTAKPIDAVWVNPHKMAVKLT